MDRVAWEAARSLAYQAWSEARDQHILLLGRLQGDLPQAIVEYGVALHDFSHALDNLLLVLAQEPPPPSLRRWVRAKLSASRRSRR